MLVDSLLNIDDIEILRVSTISRLYLRVSPKCTLLFQVVLLLQCCEFIIVSINSLLLITAVFACILLSCFCVKYQQKWALWRGSFSCWKQHQKMGHCSHKWMGRVNSSCRLWGYTMLRARQENLPHIITPPGAWMLILDRSVLSCSWLIGPGCELQFPTVFFLTGTTRVNWEPSIKNIRSKHARL